MLGAGLMLAGGAAALFAGRRQRTVQH
ncbi:hypothetical protein [Haloactinopolyspora alba]